MFYEVIPEGKVGALTYNFDDSLASGQIVLVPVGPRVVPGVVVKKVAQPEFKTKKILKVLYSKPLPRHLLETVEFISKYYVVPTGTVVNLVLPRGVEKKRRKTEHLFGNKGERPGSSLGARPSGPSPRADGARPRAAALRIPSSKTQAALSLPLQGGHPSVPYPSFAQRKDIPLNLHQKNALEGLQKAVGATKLLFGVTGSGKTNIYLRSAARALLQQKSVILLVPEIALTGQLVKVFQEIFGERIVLIHSGQTEVERHQIFEYLLETGQPKIVIGPRSALFAPVSDLGLIIIDEEHESTYYQENSPRYSAIRVASFMAKACKGECILGSATPAVEDFYLAKKAGSLVALKEKAKAEALKPEIKIIDLKKRENFSKNRYFSDELLKAIKRNLEQGRQTLIFHNRRGSSPLTICENCGYELTCPECFLPLTLHADKYELKCHTCNFHEKVPTVCPECGHPGLVHKGFGTKLLETELRRLFPEARMQRFDGDTKKGEGLSDVYADVKNGNVDILVGTQTLAKGLDLPKLATVGVVQADAGLSLPDFTAEERVFQLITQVIGRVGRGHIKTAEVFIQTFRPEHPVLKFAENEDYEGFFDYLLKIRKKGGFPPFAFIAKCTVTAKTEVTAMKKARQAAKELSLNKGFLVSPPMPAFHERNSRGYTWELIVRAKSRKALLRAFSLLDKSIRVSLDPPSLL